MALQPTGRQKRPIVLSSDNEDDFATTQYYSKTVNCSNSQSKRQYINGDTRSSHPPPKKARPKARLPTLKARSSTPTQSTPPESVEIFSKRKPNAHKKCKVKSLNTYFGATDVECNKAISQEVPNHKEHIEQREDEAEDIEDDVELGFPRHPSLRSTTRLVLDRRKQNVVPTSRVPGPTDCQKHQSSSQAFGIPEKIISERLSQNATRTPKNEDFKPWAEKYGPKDLQELVVHKKKVADVQNWIKKFWQDGNYKKLLILKGPAGAGKTATVINLAKALNINVLEWRNPKDSHLSSEGFSSMSAQFEDFLRRSGKFGSLEFDEKASDRKLVSTVEEPASDLSKKNMILLEEFPNTLSSTSAAAISFRTSLLHFLAAPPLPSMHSKYREKQTPVVLIITESHINMGSSNDEIFSAHRLLGTEILGHPSVSIIEFNTMASTFVVKALELVLKKEARQSGRRRTPDHSVLKKLSESGDVRSAISALEFLCLRNDDDDGWDGKMLRKSMGTKTSSRLSETEKDSFAQTGRREASLGLFHAVGRVVYNKREDFSNLDAVTHPQPPDHMIQHARLRISSVSPDELVDSTGTDSQTFVAALHENYIPSCEGSSFIESMNGCLNALSDSDILGPGRSGRGCHGVHGRGSSESLRQEEISFHLAVRGILFALPYPVKRHPSVSGATGKSGGKGDVFKMFYPTSLRLWKQIEEVESLVDRCGTRYEAGPLHSQRASASSHSPGTAINGLGARGKPLETISHDDRTFLPTDIADSTARFQNSSRAELILETLPYLAIIERSKAVFGDTLRELEKITEFQTNNNINNLSHRIIVDSDEIWPNLDPNADHSAAHSKDRDHASLKSKMNGRSVSTALSALSPPTKAEMAKLWLSDDDIEDE